MKRIISALLCAFMLLSAFSFVSCGNEAAGGTETAQDGEGKTLTDASPADIMTAIVAAYPDIPTQKKLYISGTAEDDDAWLDPEYAGYLYTGSYETIPEMDMLDSYAIRLPDGKSAFELHILKVADSANLASVQALLNKRIDQLNAGDIKLYDPEGFEKVMTNAEVYTVGNYVFLLITTGNDAAKTAIDSVLYK